MNRLVIAILPLLSLTTTLRAQFIDWADTSGGALAGSTITITNLTPGPELSLSNYDLTDTPYLAWPGAGDQQCLNFLCTDDWQASFDQPLTNFKLYAISWRGSDGGVSPVQYTFNRSFSILSGFTGATIAGNTLSLPDGDFYDGILQFNGTFSSLTINSNATLENAQAMTFHASPVPEPETFLVISLGLGMQLMTLRRSRAGQRRGAATISTIVDPAGSSSTSIESLT